MQPQPAKQHKKQTLTPTEEQTSYMKWRAWDVKLVGDCIPTAIGKAESTKTHKLPEQNLACSLVTLMLCAVA